eukprot:TRINITY_DN51163_c0_g1_i1.p1 TRINITY_DN51163_c0_g1~~TRINITY_DN51163_c0_g1_i1.p1  ORF type:complete len:338 (-),score=72.07 TRINITY_DN51163_c0_g1_i1:493-1506(-)
MSWYAQQSAAQWRSAAEDPYRILGCSPGAALDDIKVAYKRAALRTHPDKNGGSTEAFNAVQKAYKDVLAGLENAAQFSTQAGAGPAAWHNATAAAPAPAPVPAFDPWSSASVAAAFDPWSASRTCTAAANGTLPNGGRSTRPGEKTPAQQQQRTVPPQMSPPPGPPPAQQAAAEQATKKRKPLFEETSVITPWTGVKKRPQASAPVEMVVKNKGDAKRWVSRENRRAGFGGVYGFRLDADDDWEEEAAAPADDVPDTSLHYQDPRGVGVQAPLSPVSKPVLAATQVEEPPEQASPPVEEQPEELQFYCSKHSKLRNESALDDDGEGNPVCRPGMECC